MTVPPYASPLAFKQEDLPDIALLASTGPMKATLLRDAIGTTFRVRAIQPVCTSMPAPPSSWALPYAAMAAQDDLPWSTLDDVVLAASTFLDPILAGRSGTWSPSTWSWM